MVIKTLSGTINEQSESIATLNCARNNLAENSMMKKMCTGSNENTNCWHWSAIAIPTASTSTTAMSAILLNASVSTSPIPPPPPSQKQQKEEQQRQLSLLSIINSNQNTNSYCSTNASSNSSSHSHNNSKNSRNEFETVIIKEMYENNNVCDVVNNVEKGDAEHLLSKGQQRQQRQQGVIVKGVTQIQSNIKSHMQTKSHAQWWQWWWYTHCLVVVICLTLPLSSSAQTIIKKNIENKAANSLPKSLNLSQTQSSSLSAASYSSTSPPSNEIGATLLLPTTTLRHFTSGTNLATKFMQSTLYSYGREQLQFQRHLLTATTTSRSLLHAVERKERSLDADTLHSHDSNNGSTENFSANFNNNNNNNKNIECPSYNENSVCPCYKFEDGLFLECPGTTAMSLRTTLDSISSPIHSLSIYDFDRSVTSLSQDVFQPGVNIRHLQFSHSHLEALKDNSLKHVRASLESLSIVNGKLMQVSFSNYHDIKLILPHFPIAKFQLLKHFHSVPLFLEFIKSHVY